MRFDRIGRKIQKQKTIMLTNNYEPLNECLKLSKQKKILLVCGNSIKSLKLGKYFDALEHTLGIRVIRFSDFNPNPLYESIVEGVKVLNKEEINLIVAVGGGSAMDVAKCIKLYSNMEHSQNYLCQKIVSNDIDLIAIPTTAGSGSEATRYAVIYFNGEKQSISDYSCIPSVVFFDPSALTSLPNYYKKATMLDAMCHAIESYWSINSTEESRVYSRKAIKMIVANMDGYLANEEEGNANMLKAANLSGKAINIAQTTAGHAMCYKLTSIYGIAHGHAAALCVSRLFLYIVKNIDKCIDPRGKEFLGNVLKEISEAMGCVNAYEATEKFDKIFTSLNLGVPEPKKEDYEELKFSVNSARLKNNPVGMDAGNIDYLYHEILMKR